MKNPPSPHLEAHQKAQKNVNIAKGHRENEGQLVWYSIEKKQEYFM